MVKKKEVSIINSPDWRAVIYNRLDGTAYEVGNNKESVGNTIITVIQELEEEDNIMETIEFNNNCSFVKNFRGNGRLFRILLTPNEIAVLMFLADYVSYNDCVLRRNGNNKADIMSVSLLAKEYNISLCSFQKVMASLNRKEIIKYHKSKTIHNYKGEIINKRSITLNPYIFCRGSRINSEIRDIYSNSLWAAIIRPSTR